MPLDDGAARPDPDGPRTAAFQRSSSERRRILVVLSISIEDHARRTRNHWRRRSRPPATPRLPQLWSAHNRTGAWKTDERDGLRPSVRLPQSEGNGGGQPPQRARTREQTHVHCCRGEQGPRTDRLPYWSSAVQYRAVAAGQHAAVALRRCGRMASATRHRRRLRQQRSRHWRRSLSQSLARSRTSSCPFAAASRIVSTGTASQGSAVSAARAW